MAAPPTVHTSRHVEKLADPVSREEIFKDGQPGELVVTDDAPPVQRSDAPGRLTLSSPSLGTHQMGLVLTATPDGSYLVDCLHPLRPTLGRKPSLGIAEKEYVLPFQMAINATESIRAIDQALRELRKSSPASGGVTLNCREEAGTMSVQHTVTKRHRFLRNESSIALCLTPAELVEVRYYEPLPLSRFLLGATTAMMALIAVSGAITWSGGDTRVGKPITLVAGPLLAISATLTVLWPPVDVSAGGP